VATDPTPVDLPAFARLVAEQLAPLLRADIERLIDLDELARRIGVSPRGASGLVARNELPAGCLIGGVRRWDWDEVKRFLGAHQSRQRRRGRGRYARSAAHET
jgi:hypothetical protein